MRPEPTEPVWIPLCPRCGAPVHMTMRNSYWECRRCGWGVRQ